MRPQEVTAIFQTSLHVGSRTSTDTEPSIVFSCWKKTLLLAGQLLSNHGIKFEIIDGSLPLSKRVKVLNAFRSPLGADVLLMTLGTGAVG